MIIFGALVLSACGKPDGISDADYAKYKEFGAPKILYSCKREGAYSVDFNAVSKCAQIKDDHVKQAQCLEKTSQTGKPTTTVGYAAGVGVEATYNKLIDDAKSECDGEFKVLDGKS